MITPSPTDRPSPEPFPDPATVTVAEVIARYLAFSKTESVHCPESRVQRERILGLFADRFGHLAVATCKGFMLRDWIDERWGRRRPATKKGIANQVNAAFNWAAREGRIAANPFRRINYEDSEPRPPMPDDTLELLTLRANKRFDRALQFLRLTGCRCGELCAMTWPDVDLDRGVVTIQSHKTRKKTRKPRTIALVAEAVALLREIRRTQPAGYEGAVFLNTRNKPWNRRTIGQQLRRMKERGEITTDTTVHGIRHAFGTQAARNGCPLKLLALQMGHSSVTTTERFYVHLDGDVDAMRQAAQIAQAIRPSNAHGAGGSHA